MISEFVFTCEEAMQLSARRWPQLCALTFSLYSTGAAIEDRPEHSLLDNILTLRFKTSTKFQDYVRRAFFTEATRLVSFVVVEKSHNHVICQAALNLTPKIRILGVPLESDDDLENSEIIIA